MGEPASPKPATRKPKSPRPSTNPISLPDPPGPQKPAASPQGSPVKLPRMRSEQRSSVVKSLRALAPDSTLQPSDSSTRISREKSVRLNARSERGPSERAAKRQSMPMALRFELPPAAEKSAVDDTAINYAKRSSVFSEAGADALVARIARLLAHDATAKARDQLRLSRLHPGKPCLITLAYTDSPEHCTGYLRHLARDIKREPANYVLILDGLSEFELADDLAGKKIPAELKGVMVEAFGETRVEALYLGNQVFLERLQVALANGNSQQTPAASPLKHSLSGECRKGLLKALNESCSPALTGLARQLALGKPLLQDLASGSLGELQHVLDGSLQILEKIFCNTHHLGEQLRLLDQLTDNIRSLNLKLLTLDRCVKLGKTPALQTYREAESSQLWAQVLQRIKHHLAQDRTVLLRVGAGLLHSGSVNTGKDSTAARSARAGADSQIEAALAQQQTPYLHLVFKTDLNRPVKRDQLSYKGDAETVVSDAKLISISPLLFRH
jgi:hypothetical protein